MLLSYFAIAVFSGRVTGRLCGLGQHSFGLEGGQTGDTAEILHRPLNVHSSHDEILRFCYCPAKKEEAQTSTLEVFLRSWLAVA